MIRIAALAAALTLALSGCNSGNPAEAPRAGPPATLITVTEAKRTRIEFTEDTVGTLENFVDPKIGAEVAGRVVSVLGYVGKVVKQGDLLVEIDSQDFVIQNRSDEAEIKRLESLAEQADRFVERQSQLQKQGFISQNAVDDATAQRNAQREQLASARARSDGSRNSIRKTRVASPIDGRIEVQIVAVGDYVKVGDLLFHMVGVQRLHAHLPFPESVSQRIRVGLPVRLSSPVVPGKVINAKISEIRPTITQTSRAIDAIVKFDTDGSFRGGGTVNAQVVTAVKENVVMVPEQSIVLRPAGKIVYLVQDGKAQQQQVETGYKSGGFVEIVSGLEGGELIAMDGAGFLTHNAAVSVPRPREAKAIEPGASGRAAKTGKLGVEPEQKKGQRT